MQVVCVKISSAGLLVQDLCMRISCAYLCVKASASGSCMTTCARSLYAVLLRNISVRIFAAGSCRTTCARSLHQDLLRKISLDLCIRISAGPLVEVEPLVQDLCMRISCAYLCQDLCVRISYDHLCKISVKYRSLVQDLSARMSAAGSCRTRISCARSLFQDLCRTTPFQITQTQLDQHSGRWTRTISAEGRTWKSETATLPAIPCHRHARSPQRVALRNQKAQLHLHSAHATRTISAKGLPTFRNHASEVLRLPRHHEPRSYEMLHWPRKSVLKVKF